MCVHISSIQQLLRHYTQKVSRIYFAHLLKYFQRLSDSYVTIMPKKVWKNSFFLYDTYKT